MKKLKEERNKEIASLSLDPHHHDKGKGKDH